MWNEMDPELLKELSNLMNSSNSNSGISQEIKNQVSQLVDSEWTYVWDTWNWMKHWQWVFQYNNWNKYVWEWRRDKICGQWTYYFDNWSKYIWYRKDNLIIWEWIFYTQDWKKINQRYIDWNFVHTELITYFWHRIIKCNWKYWFVDEKWNTLLECEYDNIDLFDPIYIRNNFKKLNGIWFIVKNWKYWLFREGIWEIIIECKYKREDFDIDYIGNDIHRKWIIIKENWKIFFVHSGSWNVINDFYDKIIWKEIETNDWNINVIISALKNWENHKLFF